METNTERLLIKVFLIAPSCLPLMCALLCLLSCFFFCLLLLLLMICLPHDHFGARCLDVSISEMFTGSYTLAVLPCGQFDDLYIPYFVYINVFP